MMDYEIEGGQMFICHANANGNGCAMGVELHPARTDCQGFVGMRFAAQMDEPRQDKMFPRFEWDKAIRVKLDLVDVARVLQVFRGECESICDGKGIFIRSLGHAVRFNVRHVIEPVSGYIFEVHRVDTSSGEETSRLICLSSAEALALSLALENSMGMLAFGK